jgi:(p)ppGpp synthase/HD superfamily hydrolase
MSIKTPLLTDKFNDAMQHAFRLHGADMRKGSEIPVMAHLLSVCSLVLYDGGSEDEAIAALLHDALEDKPGLITRSEIEQLYGQKVLKIIEVSTDTPPDYAGGPKPPWRQRKAAYVKHVSQVDPALLRVTVADKVDNARALLRDYQKIGADLWSRFNAGQENQNWYYRKAAQAYKKAGFEGQLLRELKQLVAKLLRLPLSWKRKY